MSSFLKIREPLSPWARAWLMICAFALPFLAWCAVSYLPFVWHPQVLVENAGDSTLAGTYDYVSEGQRVELEVFEARNQELAKAGKKLAVGERVNPIYLPAPHQVARAFVTAFTTPPERRGDFWLHESLLHSCQIIFWGFFYAALIGIPLGVVCGTFPFLSQLTEPFVDFVRYMPAPVFGALAVAILGLADAPKITIIFIGTFFPMVLVVANTTRQVDLALMHAAQTLGAKSWQVLRHVVVPAAMPNLYRDMRIQIGCAWTYLVVAELIGEKSGISAFIYQQQRYRNFDNVYASIVIIGSIGLVCDQLLAFAARFLFPWESKSLGLLAQLKRLRRSSAKPLPGAAEVVGVSQ